MADSQSGTGPVGLVLAGGGARGAYELGALSVLLPALEERGERPRVIVGTSVGALNAAFLAGTAELPVEEVVERGLKIWSDMRFGQVLSHVASPSTLRRLACYAGQFMQIRGARLNALLDPGPLRRTLTEIVPIEQIERNVDAGKLDAIAVVATSASTSRSVAFHRGGATPPADNTRAIDYVNTPLTDEHVRASAAIPGLFPAVHVSSPAEAEGWYFDGGTQLNTPIKPALSLGAERVVVVALNAVVAAPEQIANEHRPDALEGASQLIQALLVTPLAHDMATLADVNEIVRRRGSGPNEKKELKYIFIAPDRANAIGELARRVFNEHYADLADALHASDLTLLGRAVAGGSNSSHGELLSYLFFAPEFTGELVKLGRADAERWLGEHKREIWETGPFEVARAR
ncbi:MAG TPA: patatin-like phospholipase family protein [Solirubrobacteraceae bacterium]|nr:patatin-like phospholipase family protein [Solirubrobacteraceae bacterium]